MNETYLALDLGATKLLIGEVNKKGEILNSKRYETGYMDQLSAFSIIKRSLEDYISTIGWATSARPVSMGAGLMGGRVDNGNGIWLQIDPKRSQEIPLAEDLSRTFEMPCFIDNDVKSATRAVKRWGLWPFVRQFHIHQCRLGYCCRICCERAAYQRKSF